MHSSRTVRQIILASASPRRKELLALTGLQFRVVPSRYEEDMSLRLSPHRLARFLSLEKAREVGSRHGDALVIAADTFICRNGRLMGKPATLSEAKEMLLSLRGRAHLVVTGFTIIDAASGRTSSKSVGTRVFFRKVAEREIDEYVASGEPMDKAGAYAIQGLGSVLIRKIEGDYFNVIGLPLCALVTELKRFGVRVL
ncbi:MAG: Maf family protein [Nitrospiraceae bacterium]|nr:Maf family protein [Nitrospiraceae bacterium]